MANTIVHVSDPHFGNRDESFDRAELKNSLIEYINNFEGEKALVISGDITYKANPKGYEEAEKFFSDVLSGCSISRSNVIICPGNHDIEKNHPPFKNFNSFSYSLRRDNLCSVESKSESILPIGDSVFFVANSAHHLDHQYGLISKSTISLMTDEAEQILKFKNKIFVTHHHLIGVYKSDSSTIRNARELIYNLDSLGFNYVLHGHQHSTNSMLIGSNGITVESGRSLNFPSKNSHNGFNLIDLKNKITKRMVVSPDTHPSKLTFKELK